jgi:Transposase DDE domain group 1
MGHPTGETNGGALGLDFDRRLKLQFRGSAITSDAGLLAYRELDDVLALTTIGGERLADARTGKNSRHLLVGLLRQSVFGRLAGYEDVNDAERLRRDPAMRLGGRRPSDHRVCRLRQPDGATTRKCSECTTSWTKHERAARWYVRSTLDGCRSGGGGVTSLTCQEPTFTGPLPNRRSRP